MQEVKLSVQTLNMVMGYLGTKPYQEVFQIIEAVQKEVAAQQTAPATQQDVPSNT
jgi:hypothetical protein